MFDRTIVEKVKELRKEEDGSEASENEEDDIASSKPVSKPMRVLAMARMILDKQGVRLSETMDAISLGTSYTPAEVVVVAQGRSMRCCISV